MYIKEYNKIGKYKFVEIESIWNFKTVMIISALGMVKMIDSSWLQEIKKSHGVELFIYSGEYFQCKENVSTVHAKHYFISESMQVNAYILPPSVRVCTEQKLKEEEDDDDKVKSGY